MKFNIPRNNLKYPEIHVKYLRVKEIPKNLILYFKTAIQPKPDLLPGIFSNYRPDIEKPFPLGTANLSSKMRKYV